MADTMREGTHVVRFSDGAYLTSSLYYGSRVAQQWYAQRFSRQAAREVAKLLAFHDAGARAVRIVSRDKEGGGDGL